MKEFHTPNVCCIQRRNFRFYQTTDYNRLFRYFLLTNIGVFDCCLYGQFIIVVILTEVSGSNDAKQNYSTKTSVCSGLRATFCFVLKYEFSVV